MNYEKVISLWDQFHIHGSINHNYGEKPLIRIITQETPRNRILILVFIWWVHSTVLVLLSFLAPTHQYTSDFKGWPLYKWKWSPYQGISYSSFSVGNFHTYLPLLRPIKIRQNIYCLTDGKTKQTGRKGKYCERMLWSFFFQKQFPVLLSNNRPSWGQRILNGLMGNAKFFIYVKKWFPSIWTLIASSFQ